MDWPKTPVERLQAFRPPFCPRPGCPEHLRRDGRFRSNVHGYFPTKRGARVTRYVCARCGKTFCQRTFSARYFLKRPELLVPVAAGLVAGSAHRQIARSLGCSPSTVTRLAARLGRHAMLLTARALSRLEGWLDETVNVARCVLFVARRPGTSIIHNQGVCLTTREPDAPEVPRILARSDSPVPTAVC